MSRAKLILRPTPGSVIDASEQPLGHDVPHQMTDHSIVKLAGFHSPSTTYTIDVEFYSAGTIVVAAFGSSRDSLMN